MNENEKKKLKIFICISEPDIPDFKELFTLLNQAFDWIEYFILNLDNLPGTTLKKEIKKQIKESNVFITCHSPKSQSAQTKGLYPFTYKKILEAIEELPYEQDICIIPILLDNCNLPSHLEELKPLALKKANLGQTNQLLNIKKSLYKLADFYNVAVTIPATLAEDKESGKIQHEGQNVERFLKQLSVDMVKFLERFDYAGAYSLTYWKDYKNTLNIRFATDRRLLKFLRYVAERLSFNLRKAENLLGACGLETQPGLRGYYPLPDPTTSKDLHKEALWFGAGAISELYWHCDLLWETAHFSDYLARLKTLTDRLAVFMLEIITEIPFSYEETSCNESHLFGVTPDFSKLGGLNAAFANRIQMDKRDKKEKDKNPLDVKIGKVGFSRETDAAQENVELILAGNLTDPRTLYLDFQLKNNNVLISNTTITVQTDLQVFLTNTAVVAALQNLAALIFYKEDSGTYKKGSLPVYNLTKLRNSLPPAHSFGSIDADIIYAATKGGIGWKENTPPHTVIATSLAALWDELKKTKTWKDCPVQFSPEHEKSPFKEINRQIEKLLNDVRKSR